MKYSQYGVLCAVLFGMFSCGSDDVVVDTDTTLDPSLPNITAFAEVNSEILEVTLLNDQQRIRESNLTQTTGLTNDFVRLLQNAGLATFFTISGNDFEVHQLDILSGETLQFGGLCQLDAEEGLNEPFASRSSIGFFTFEANPQNDAKPLNNLRISNQETQECSKTLIDAGELFGARAVRVVNNELLANFSTEENQFALVKIDLNTSEVVRRIEFTNPFRVVVNEGVMFIFFEDNTYQSYAQSDFGFLSAGSMGPIQFFEGYGFIDKQVVDAKLLVDVSYIQPSSIESGPGIYDLETNELLKGGDFFLLDVTTKIEQEIGEGSVRITRYLADIETELVICSYERVDGSGEGGIVYTNFEAELLSHVPTTIAPEFLIRHTLN